MRERGSVLARTEMFLVGDPQLGQDLVQEVLSKLALRWRSVSKARVVLDTPELDALVARHPAGLITLTTWLKRSD